MDWYAVRPSWSTWKRSVRDVNRLNTAFRMPVQWVNRPNLDFRGFSGFRSPAARSSPATGSNPAVGKQSTVVADRHHGRRPDEAVAGQSVTLTLADEIDMPRAATRSATADDPPEVADQFETTMLWMADEPILPGRPTS
jgi:bifunctional enzyme CysN/CysC